ncbi:MAG: hypothetical protein AAF682_23710 [Planctomycetota bacterium]
MSPSALSKHLPPRSRIHGLLVAAVVGLTLSDPTAAQWSKDPALYNTLSDGAGEEVQPKAAPAPDGTTFVSFYDSDPAGSPAFGYDVKIQRIDPQGKPLWTAGGILVADRGYSSTQDYGLAAGPNGDAFLAFRDDRFTGDQITVARVLEDGALAWGANGVQVTSTTAFVAAPEVTATPDGGCVVGWTEGSTTRLQKLDAGGAPQWGGGVTVPVAGGDTASMSGIGANPDGSVVFSWVFQSGGFFGPRHIRAQKLDASGAPEWGAGVDVFTSGSIQIGNFPGLVADGAGGALFAWYGVSPLQCYAQHVRSDGSQSFGTPGTGVPVSTDATQARVNPSLAYHQATDEAYVFWIEQTISQSMDGVWGQKLDGTGARLWGPNGISYVPLGSDDLGQIRALARDDGATALWLGGPGFGQDETRGVRVDPAGVPQHAPVAIATTPSSKDDLAVSAGPFGDAFAIWHGDENGDNDVIGQNLLVSSGSGPAAGGLSRTAGTNPDSYSATVEPLGGTLHLQVDLTSTGHALGAVAAFPAPAAIPFGSDVILVDPFGPELLGLPLLPGPVPSWSVPLPGDPLFCGLTIFTQAVHVDLTLPLRFTNAVDAFLGL